MKIAATPTKTQQVSFHKNVMQEKVIMTRVVVILGALLFIIYSVMDYFGLEKQVLEILYTVRALNLLVLGGIFALTFKPVFQKHYVKILMFGYFCSGITISVGIFYSFTSDYSYDLYFASLMVLVITAFSWSYLPIRHSILISSFFTATYVFIKVYYHQDYEGTRFLTLISHVFFLISVSAIAAIAQYIRDNLIYKNLKLQESLKIIAEAKTKEAKKQQVLASLDALTGIPNRRYITEQLRTALTEVENSGKLLTLIFIDLNGFKLINDTYGHDSGDNVLQITAKRLSGSIRKGDYIARLGGDEFLIGFKTNHFSASFIDSLVEKLKITIAAPIAFQGQKLHVGASMGIARYPADGETIEELIKVADQHMYLDKQNNQYLHISAIHTSPAI